MNADLIKRLRTMTAISCNPIGDDAADAIEALQRELTEAQMQLAVERNNVGSLTRRLSEVESIDKSKLKRLVTQVFGDGYQIVPPNTNDSNEWRDAMHDLGIVCWSLTKENENDPRKLLAAIVDFNVKIALDPAVSQDARDLIKMGRDGCVPGSTQQCIG